MPVPQLKVGSSHESETLEFKAKFWPRPNAECSLCEKCEKCERVVLGAWSRRMEMAKDIAGMANASGGHIIVGASEKRHSGTLAGFCSPSLPKNWEGDLRHVTSQMTTPPVQVWHDRLLIDGHQLLVLEVVASLEPVVVFDPADERGPIYLPIRHGTQVKFMHPHHSLAAIASPNRRWFLRLTQLKNRGLLLFSEREKKNPQNWNPDTARARYHVADVGTDYVKLRTGQTVMTIPLDYVDAIWPAGHEDEEWCMRVHGVVTGATFIPP